MSRLPNVYINDMLGAIEKIQRYTAKMSYEAFKDDELVQDATIRNLEILGEAAKKIPDEIKIAYSDVEWKKVAGLRDILIHDYFGIDTVIIWDVIQNKLPSLQELLRKITKDFL